VSQEAETENERGKSGAPDEHEHGEAAADSGASDETTAAQDDQPDRATLDEDTVRALANQQLCRYTTEGRIRSFHVVCLPVVGVRDVPLDAIHSP
jgi:hypothetical protein